MLPLYSADEIWRRLGNDVQGFCTSRTKNKIPNCPGVYAWYLPFKLGSDIDETIRLYKSIALYNCKNKGEYEEKHSTQFQWQFGEIQHKLLADHSVERGQKDKWEDLLNLMDQEQHKAFDQLFHMTSIFHRPLYVGLTNNLESRYEQHITSSENKNNFRSRFEGYMEKINCDITLKDLVFSFIAFKPSFSEKNLSDSQISILEYMLKNICNPIFGEK